jgi:uncharacterized membrane protein YphA (DoxX/SURF4 family)
MRHEREIKYNDASQALRLEYPSHWRAEGITAVALAISDTNAGALLASTAATCYTATTLATTTTTSVDPAADPATPTTAPTLDAGGRFDELAAGTGGDDAAGSRWIWAFAVAVVGGVIGAFLLIGLPPRAFELVVPVLLVVAAALAVLRDTLLAQPKASGVLFALSRTDNLLSTKTMTGQARVIPLAYPEVISLDLGFFNPALQIQAV